MIPRLLPNWMPNHPWRWFIHCRVVYLPMSFLYTNKCQMPMNSLIEELRNELYVQPFSSIDFQQHRNTVAATDIKRQPSMVVRLLNLLLRTWEAYLRPLWLHRLANNTVQDLIRLEDINTSYNDIAVVSKALQMVAVHFSNGDDSGSLAKHREKLPTYLWQSDEGMTSNSTNGVQVWDTALIVLAVIEAGLISDQRFKPSMMKALMFLEMSQLRDNAQGPYRQQRKGGWPFSTKDNGHIVSDCSAESMKAVIMLQEEWQAI